MLSTLKAKLRIPSFSFVPAVVSLIVPVSVTVTQNNSVTLICKTATEFHLPGYNTSLTIAWYHNSTELKASTNVEIKPSGDGKSFLKLEETDWRSSGKYQCHATLNAIVQNGSNQINASDVGSAIVTFEPVEDCISDVCNEVKQADLFPFGEDLGDKVHPSSVNYKSCAEIPLTNGGNNFTARFFPGQSTAFVSVSRNTYCLSDDVF